MKEAFCAVWRKQLRRLEIFVCFFLLFFFFHNARRAERYPPTKTSETQYIYLNTKIPSFIQYWLSLVSKIYTFLHAGKDVNKKKFHEKENAQRPAHILTTVSFYLQTGILFTFTVEYKALRSIIRLPHLMLPPRSTEPPHKGKKHFIGILHRQITSAAFDVSLKLGKPGVASIDLMPTVHRMYDF